MKGRIERREPEGPVGPPRLRHGPALNLLVVSPLVRSVFNVAFRKKSV